MFNDYPDILFINDIKELLNISSTTAYSLFRSGAIGGTKIGKSWFTTKEQLIEYVRTSCHNVYKKAK